MEPKARAALHAPEALVHFGDAEGDPAADHGLVLSSLHVASDPPERAVHVLDRVGRREASTPAAPIAKPPTDADAPAVDVDKILLQRRDVTLPRDRELVGQVHAIKRRVLPSGNVSFDAERNARGHVDKFWAVALACPKERSPSGPRTGEIGVRVLG